jgi:hypothetical protein
VEPGIFIQRFRHSFDTSQFLIGGTFQTECLRLNLSRLFMWHWTASSKCGSSTTAAALPGTFRSSIPLTSSLLRWLALDGSVAFCSRAQPLSERIPSKVHLL